MNDILKPFQKKTVDHVMHLFDDGQNRVLVADETGLGKTIIAKGVVETMVEENKKKNKRKPKDERKSLSVIYVCSNAVLSKKNVEKLLPKDKKERKEYKIENERLPLLYVSKIENGSKATYYPITLRTSAIPALGNEEERALMYAIIEKYILNDKRRLFNRNHKTIVKEMFLNDVDEDRFDDKIKKYSSYKFPAEEIREIKNLYYLKNLLKSLETCKTEAKKNGKLNLRNLSDSQRNGKNIRKDIKKYTRYIIKDYFTFIKDIIKELRDLFSRKALVKISPDLVIFDEFQNFSDDLLKKQRNANDNNQTEIQDALNVLLSGGGNENCKFLFLSATPFKFYATDAEKGGKSYQGFKDVVKFLCDYDKKEEQIRKWIDNQFTDFQNAREVFLNGNKTKDDYIKAKDNMEDFLYGVMCRTEKPIKENKQTDKEKESLKLSPSDYDINATLTLLRRSETEHKKVIKLAESCPYIKSFSTKKSHNDDEDVYNSLADITPIDESDKYLWLDADKGKWDFKDTHAKYAFLHNTVFKNNDAEKLLWIPPLNKNLKLNGPFKNARGYSKLLVFSKWSVVPRMASVLLSYEQSKDLKEEKISKTVKAKLNCELKDYLKKSDKIPDAVCDKILDAVCEYLTNPDAVRVIYSCDSNEITFVDHVLEYCQKGCLRETIEEYLELPESEENLIKALKMKGSKLKINTINKGQGQKDPFLPIHFSMPFSSENEMKEEEIQNAFNSPFWPFVLTMTDKGAEGFDFHYYCDSIMHWNLPANPVVLEQREGRVDRYRSYAVRKSELKQENGESGLYPDWMRKDKKIHVYIPCYENSEECTKYEKLAEDRKKYRAAFGQDNQEDFVRFLEDKNFKDAKIKELSINLSPYFNQRLRKIEEYVSKKTNQPCRSLKNRTTSKCR